VVILVLAIAWGAVLVAWARSRSRGSFGDSVGTFHRHLHVLERTAPSTLPPANRLRGPVVSPVPLSSRLGSPQGLGGVPRPAAPSWRGYPSPYAASRPLPAGAGAPRSSPVRRSQVLKRRRDVLFVLVVAVLATFVIAVGAGGHALWVLQLATDAALGGYVALLVRIRNLSLEREQKLRVLHRPVPVRLAPAVGYGDLEGASGGYSKVDSAGYGQLALRRVAN
jgi:hypothetical protein